MRSPNSDMIVAQAYYSRNATVQADGRRPDEQQRYDYYSRVSAQAELLRQQQRQHIKPDATPTQPDPVTSFSQPNNPYSQTNTTEPSPTRQPDTRPSYRSRRSAQAIARLKELGYDPQSHVFPPPGWKHIPQTDRTGLNHVGYFPMSNDAGVPLQREKASKGKKREQESRAKVAREAWWTNTTSSGQ
ncbi:hypothetical protein B9479_008301 [Cryptococcus floricola]|uniref:Uncharacterized protein n=1 Tax=Cryptococcus floricola TaxID=2591691 RepID=A0A5D3AMA0_9TREE|nr:hypothetical protein B9479_008301 [Cryptococcus floricola]